MHAELEKFTIRLLDTEDGYVAQIFDAESWRAETEPFATVDACLHDVARWIAAQEAA